MDENETNTREREESPDSEFSDSESPDSEFSRILGSEPEGETSLGAQQAAESLEGFQPRRVQAPQPRGSAQTQRGSSDVQPDFIERLFGGVHPAQQQALDSFDRAEELRREQLQTEEDRGFFDPVPGQVRVRDFISSLPVGVAETGKEILRSYTRFGVSTGELVGRVATQDFSSRVEYEVPGLGFLGPVESHPSAVIRRMQEGDSALKAVATESVNVLIDQPLGLPLTALGLSTRTKKSSFPQFKKLMNKLARTKNEKTIRTEVERSFTGPRQAQEDFVQAIKRVDDPDQMMQLTRNYMQSPQMTLYPNHPVAGSPRTPGLLDFDDNMVPRGGDIPFTLRASPDRLRNMSREFANETDVNAIKFTLRNESFGSSDQLDNVARQLVNVNDEQSALRILNKQHALRNHVDDSVENLLKPQTIDGIQRDIGIFGSALKGDPNAIARLNKGERVTRVWADHIRQGKIDPELNPEMRAFKIRNNLNDNFELAAAIEGEIQASARSLSTMSNLKRTMASQLKEAGVRNPLKYEPDMWQRINWYGKDIHNAWRASLTGQLGTATRNLGTSGARLMMRTVEDAMVGAMMRVTGNAPTIRSAMTPAIEDLRALASPFSKSGRKRLDNIFKIMDETPGAQTRAFDTVVGDISAGGTNMAGRYANLVSSFNRLQSYAVRTPVISSRISAWAIAQGKDPTTIRSQDIPPGVLNDAIDIARQVDFTAMPKGRVGREFINAMNRYWPLQVVTLPFPRYFSNAMRYTIEYSPLTLHKLVSPRHIRKMAAGDEEAVRDAVKMTMGSMMWAGAYYLRNSEYAGDKWYELNINGKTWDTRLFGPVLPAYMFIAEVMNGNSDRFAMRDWIEGWTGINRIAGTTLFLTSFLQDADRWDETRSLPDNVKDLIQGMGGEYVGGFGNPLITFRDLSSTMIDEAEVMRYTKERPFTGPLMSRIPGVSNTLPENPRITRDEPFRQEHPLLRQFTGMQVNEKNKLESEMDKLDINYWDKNPKTGDAWIDRLIMEEMGPIAQRLNDRMEQSEEFDTWNQRQRKEFIDRAFTEVTREARQNALQKHKDEIIEKYLEDMHMMSDQERHDYIRKRRNNGVLPDFIIVQIERVMNANTFEN